MDENNLLIIVLAFVVGFMLQGFMKNMCMMKNRCGGRLIEGRSGSSTPIRGVPTRSGSSTPMRGVPIRSGSSTPIRGVPIRSGGAAATNKVDKAIQGLRPVGCWLGINPETGEKTTTKYKYAWQMEPWDAAQGCSSSISGCSDRGHPLTAFYAPVIPGSEKLNLKPDLNQAMVCYGNRCDNKPIEDELVECQMYETEPGTQDEKYFTQKNADNKYEEV